MKLETVFHHPPVDSGFVTNDPIVCCWNSNLTLGVISNSKWKNSCADTISSASIWATSKLRLVHYISGRFLDIKLIHGVCETAINDTAFLLKNFPCLALIWTFIEIQMILRKCGIYFFLLIKAKSWGTVLDIKVSAARFWFLKQMANRNSLQIWELPISITFVSLLCLLKHILMILEAELVQMLVLL